MPEPQDFIESVDFTEEEVQESDTGKIMSYWEKFPLRRRSKPA